MAASRETLRQFFCIFDLQMTKENLNMVLVGAGNVATHLGRAWHKAGVKVLQVYSRTQSMAVLLAEELGAEAISDTRKIMLSADVVVFSLRDNSYAEVLQGLNFGNTLLLHTSGSLDMQILTYCSSQIGVIYPLQTFNKHKALNISSAPFLLETLHAKDMHVVERLAAMITDNILHVSSNQRAALHVSAVFSCNFVNYLYSVAEELLMESGMSFDVLRPLILETAHKVMTVLPSKVQTGPAVRKDTSIISKHLKNLENNPEYRELYKNLTEKIIYKYKTANTRNDG